MPKGEIIWLHCFFVLRSRDKMGFKNFGGFNKTIFINIPPCVFYFEHRNRKPAIISRSDWIHIRKLSGKNMDNSIPRPADNRHIPRVNDSLFNVRHLLFRLLHCMRIYGSWQWFFTDLWTNMRNIGKMLWKRKEIFVNGAFIWVKNLTK